MKNMFSFLSMAFVALAMSCQPVAPENPGDDTGNTPVVPPTGEDEIPAVTVPEKTGAEFEYKTVEYRRKSNGAYPYGYESTNSKKTLTLDGMKWMTRNNVNMLDKWGGNPELKVTDIRSSNPAGFWRTGKVGDRWYFVNPSGNATVLHGINGVLPDPARDGTTAETKQWYNMLFNGDVATWAEYAGNQILAEYGFNFFSASTRRPQYFWDYFTESTIKQLRSPRPGVENGEVEILFMLRTFAWDYSSRYGFSLSDNEYNKFILLFNPDYLTYIDELAKTATAPFKDSQNLIGYYIDNELPFNSYQDNNPLKGIELKHFLELKDRFTSSDRQGYDEFAGARNFAKSFMLERGVQPEVKNITTKLRNEFRYEVARYYYKTMTEALRKHDPNHLILGSRLFDSSMYNEWTVRACAEFCDVVSVNYYNHWYPTVEYCKNQMGVWSDKPFIVTEFYTKGDGTKYGGTPYENKEGAGWIVPDQISRAYYYQNFTIRLLQMKNCAGWQWFEFMDNYGDGGSTRWTGANKGVVSARFEPYTECLELMRQLHWNIYRVTDYIDYENTSTNW